MSNSALVNYTKLSPNYNPRQGKIKKITIHHMAGNLSVETCGNVFAPASRQASSNYGVDTNGRVGMYVEEHNRAWTSASPDNDHQAITIEVANDGGAPDWHVSDKALAKTIELCVDICKRNGIPKLTYTGDASGNLTRHDMFAQTNCPGPYLGSKFAYIAQEVNKRLGASTTTTSAPSTKPSTGTTKYSIGIPINTAILASSSDGKGEVFKKDHWSGTIGRVIAGARYPYRVDSGSVAIGWTDDVGIDTCPHVPGQSASKPTTAAKPATTNKIAQEAARWGMKVGTKDTVKNGFYISENATIYGGASYGVKVPDSIKKATTFYTCGGTKHDHDEWWVLAKQIMSWVKVSETLVK